jgi:hypothetical protein
LRNTFLKRTPGVNKLHKIRANRFHFQKYFMKSVPGIWLGQLSKFWEQDFF